MRFKAVPSPRAESEPPADAADSPDGLGDLAAVRDALPRVPRPEADCCARIATSVEWIENRDAAREWLVFLRALGLSTRTSSGSYVRARSGGDEDGASGSRGHRRDLGDQFAANVLGAREVLDALDDEPRTPPELLDAVRSVVPEWERRRSDDWEAAWTREIRNRLDWWVLLGRARRVEEGYVGVGGQS